MLEIWQKHIIEIGKKKFLSNHVKVKFLSNQVKVDMHMDIKSKGKGFSFARDFAPETAHPSFESVYPLAVEFLVRT